MKQKKISKSTLAALRKLLVKAPDKDSKFLWDTVTGLRGPDNSEDYGDTKDATTGVVRWHVLGVKAGYGDPDYRSFNGAVFGPDDENKCGLRQKLGASHFKQHAQRAFEALGLKWNEVNK